MASNTEAKINQNVMALMKFRTITEGGTKNGTFKIQESLPQYFQSEVLQRNTGSNNSYFGTIKFQVAFNLAVVWMIVFVSLSKGLRSYGKVKKIFTTIRPKKLDPRIAYNLHLTARLATLVGQFNYKTILHGPLLMFLNSLCILQAVYMLIFLPICGTLVLCTKLLTLIPYDSVTNIFSETEWTEFFINSNVRINILHFEIDCIASVFKFIIFCRAGQRRLKRFS